MLLGLRRSPFAEIEKSIGYRFRIKRLLESALTHRSFRFESQGPIDDNQRLEFLGDAVLNLAVAASLYERFSDDDEGVLTSYRSQITSGKALADVAAQVCLGRHLRMGKGEEASGGRTRPTNLADALEAVLGAAFLDGGMAAAIKVFKRLFDPVLDRLSGDVWADNPKGKLQELCQRRWRQGPVYRLLSTTGPAHALLFSCEVAVEGHFSASGTGTSKREAEARAAEAALARLHAVPDGTPDRASSGTLT